MNNFTSQELRAFVRESNKIEGITRPPRDEEIEVSEWFLNLGVVITSDLEKFVNVVAPGAELRSKTGMDVRVGSHFPPPGGPKIKAELDWLLIRHVPFEFPYWVHVRYEFLHPFMDGNGRSGRILWAHQMLRRGIWPGIQLGFLHAFYYQSLEAFRGEQEE